MNERREYLNTSLLRCVHKDACLGWSRVDSIKLMGEHKRILDVFCNAEWCGRNGNASGKTKVVLHCSSMHANSSQHAGFHSVDIDSSFFRLLLFLPHAGGLHQNSIWSPHTVPHTPEGAHA